MAILSMGAPNTERERVAPPWDHLRENRFPAHVYLNKKRLAEYKMLFEGLLDVVRAEVVTERVACSPKNCVPSCWRRATPRRI